MDDEDLAIASSTRGFTAPRAAAPAVTNSCPRVQDQVENVPWAPWRRPARIILSGLGHHPLVGSVIRPESGQLANVASGETNATHAALRRMLTCLLTDLADAGSAPLSLEHLLKQYHLHDGHKDRTCLTSALALMCSGSRPRGP